MSDLVNEGGTIYLDPGDDGPYVRLQGQSAKSKVREVLNNFHYCGCGSKLLKISRFMID